jgi:pimeloyl-ACP methyl ester carboxylesterase
MPLLLFHGSAGNSAMWMGDVRAWAGHYRVYSIDLIGEAGLSAPTRPPLASGEYALWLDDVLKVLSITKASILGVSRRMARSGLQHSAAGACHKPRAD